MGDLMMRDLFGQEAVEAPPRGTPARGYAARPGSGPAGETCGSCFPLKAASPARCRASRPSS